MINKIIILTFPRCGSKYFVSLFSRFSNCGPTVSSDPFADHSLGFFGTNNKKNPWFHSFQKFIDISIENKNQARTDRKCSLYEALSDYLKEHPNILVFKIFLHDISDALYEKFIKDDKALFVILERNVLDSYISNEKAKILSKWGGTVTTNIKFEPQVQKFKDYISHIEKYRARNFDKLKNTFFLTYQYDDIINLSEKNFIPCLISDFRIYYQLDLIPNKEQNFIYVPLQDKGMNLDIKKKLITSDNPIHLCFATDSTYISYLPTLIRSIYVSNPMEKIVLHVIFVGITPDEKIYFCNDINSKYSNFVVNTYDYNIETLSKFYKSSKISNHVSATTMVRIMIPNILKNVEKVIYLDIDTLVQCKLRNLYSKSVGKCGLAAVIDNDATTFFLLCDKNDQLFNQTKVYFNAGVMLMNLIILRNNNFIQKCLDLFHKYKCNDQILINIYAENETQIGKLEKMYNFNCFADSNMIFDGTKKKYLNGIIHYVGPLKPWTKMDYTFEKKVKLSNGLKIGYERMRNKFIIDEKWFLNYIPFGNQKVDHQKFFDDKNKLFEQISNKPKIIFSQEGKISWSNMKNKKLAFTFPNTQKGQKSRSLINSNIIVDQNSRNQKSKSRSCCQISDQSCEMRKRKLRNFIRCLRSKRETVKKFRRQLFFRFNCKQKNIKLPIHHFNLVKDHLKCTSICSPYLPDEEICCLFKRLWLQKKKYGILTNRLTQHFNKHSRHCQTNARIYSRYNKQQTICKHNLHRQINHCCRCKRN